ncbi:MAG TPA: lanthionine synthetase LanC family protein [Polyangiaceae bacterium]|nr:lanthionine synthetase LanC family protein [Polyangiaceae bacterium]
MSGGAAPAPKPWRALATGALAERARSAALDIAEALPDFVPHEGEGAEPPSWQYAQVALVHAHAAKALGGGAYAASAERYLELASESLAHEGDPGVSLYCGIAGVAFCAADAGRGSGVPVALDEIDEAIEDYLAAERWAGPYDLVSGLVGLGVYALERLPASRRMAASVLRHLEALAERTELGLRWATPRGDGAGVRYDLGLAHGAPGVVALAARCLAAGVEPRQSERLVRGALCEARARRLPESAASAYPYFVGEGIAPAATKPAWCYGDPGVAAAWLAAARALGSAPLEREAIELARRAGARDPEASKIVDAGLCHGTLGLAHMLNRMHQATGDGPLGEAALAWLERGLAMRREGRGVAGYAFYYAPDGKTTQWVDDPTFLSGAAGVALALLAFASDSEPTWDALLLLSGPP